MKFLYFPGKFSVCFAASVVSLVVLMIPLRSVAAMTDPRSIGPAFSDLCLRQLGGNVSISNASQDRLSATCDEGSNRLTFDIWQEMEHTRFMLRSNRSIIERLRASSESDRVLPSTLDYQHPEPHVLDMDFFCTNLGGGVWKADVASNDDAKFGTCSGKGISLYLMGIDTGNSVLILGDSVRVAAVTP